MKAIILSILIFIFQFNAFADLVVGTSTITLTPNTYTDGTTAFQNAFATASAGNLTVFVKPGTYYLNATIDESNVRIVGDGVILKPYTASNPVITIDPSSTWITNISLSNIKIIGNGKAGDGIFVKNNASSLIGCAHLSLDRVFVDTCRYGFNDEGASLWFKFYDCGFNNNKGGLRLVTKWDCNLWDLIACTFNFNDTFGVYVKNLYQGYRFLNHRYQSCNFESNGTNVTGSDIWGGYFESVEMLSLENLYCEGNGDSSNSNTYGIKITGTTGRLFSINSCWIVESKYPLYVDGTQKSGTVSNTFFQKSSGSSGEDLNFESSWSNDEPKITVQNCIGVIKNTYDIGARMPLDGIDWDGSQPSAISMKNRKWLKIHTINTNVRLTTISGLIKGQEFGLINYSGGNSYDLIIDGSLTVTGNDIVIPANKAGRFVVDTYPSGEEGKIRAIDCCCTNTSYL